MISLKEKVEELMLLPPGDVQASAMDFLTRSASWPINTRVPLNEFAMIIAAMVLEPDRNVRRACVSDAVKLTETTG